MGAAARRPYTARVPRLWIVCAALLLTAVLAPPASAQTPLTAERFALLDDVYTATIALADRPSAKDFSAARAACRALDSADALLGPLRKACTAGIKMVKPIDEFARCRTALGCLRSARRARIALNDGIRTARAANAAIDAAMLVGACRRELRASKAELRVLERMRSLLRLVQETLVTGSPTLARRVRREADAVDRLAAKQPSPARERKLFRAACAPPAA